MDGDVQTMPIGRQWPVAFWPRRPMQTTALPDNGPKVDNRSAIAVTLYDSRIDAASVLRQTEGNELCTAA